MVRFINPYRVWEIGWDGEQPLQYDDYPRSVASLSATFDNPTQTFEIEHYHSISLSVFLNISAIRSTCIAMAF